MPLWFGVDRNNNKIQILESCTDYNSNLEPSVVITITEEEPLLGQLDLFVAYRRRWRRPATIISRPWRAAMMIDKQEKNIFIDWNAHSTRGNQRHNTGICLDDANLSIMPHQSPPSIHPSTCSVSLQPPSDLIVWRRSFVAVKIVSWQWAKEWKWLWDSGGIITWE